MDVTISRVQTAQDFRRLHDLLIEYDRRLPAHLRLSVEPDLEEIERTYRGANAAFLAAIGEVEAGCAAVLRLDARSAVLKRVFVQPSLRGHGAARALVTAAIAFSRENGYERIVLDTHAQELPAAYALYVSLGFTACEPYGEVDYASPTFMELPLR